MTLGRALALALHKRHAQWAIESEHETRTAAVARRVAHSPSDLVNDADPADAAALLSE
jgi:hypothetical protein